MEFENESERYRNTDTDPQPETEQEVSAPDTPTHTQHSTSILPEIDITQDTIMSKYNDFTLKIEDLRKTLESQILLGKMYNTLSNITKNIEKVRLESQERERKLELKKSVLLGNMSVNEFLYTYGIGGDKQHSIFVAVVNIFVEEEPDEDVPNISNYDIVNGFLESYFEDTNIFGDVVGEILDALKNKDYTYDDAYNVVKRWFDLTKSYEEQYATDNNNTDIDNNSMSCV